MAKLTTTPKIDCRVSLHLNEAELRALDALAGYGVDSFIEAFYEKLGKAYMENHEQGLRDFLQSIREIVPGILSRLDDARKVFEPQPKKVKTNV